MKNIIAAFMLVGFIAGGVHAQTPIPKENLISYWTGEPNPGTGRRLDEIGSNHLWDAPETAVMTGIIGNATDADGSAHLRTKLITNSAASGIQSYGQEITYAGWIQVDSLQNDQIIASRWSRWAPGREFRLSYIASSGVLQLEWSDSANTAVTTIADDLTISADTWYFVVFGRSDSTATLSLSVTAGDDAAPRTAVTQESVPANPDGQAGELWFMYNQIDKENQYGAWDEWAVYNKILTAGELAWLFNGGDGRTYTDFEYVVEPTLEFFHDMEQEEPARGRISYYSFTSATAALSTEQAKDGNQSLKITGAWGQIQLFNDTDTDYWCTTDKCRVSMDIYMVDFAGGMLFQIDGKTTTTLTDLDTNEGRAVRFHTRNGERGFSIGTRTSGYSVPLNQWVHIDYLHDRTRTAPDNSTELYADGVLIASVEGETAPYTPTPYVAKAWHHISLGNDMINEPTFYIDNFEVAPEPWDDSTTTAISITDPGQNHLVPAVNLINPDPSVFQAMEVYNAAGRRVYDAVQAKAGTYYYRMETAAGTKTGSFIKIKK